MLRQLDSFLLDHPGRQNCSNWQARALGHLSPSITPHPSLIEVGIQRFSSSCIWPHYTPAVEKRPFNSELQISSELFSPGEESEDSSWKVTASAPAVHWKDWCWSWSSSVTLDGPTIQGGILLVSGAPETSCHWNSPLHHWSCSLMCLYLLIQSWHTVGV